MACTQPVFNIGKSKYDAVLFDLDGVITKTAKVHAAAWKALFDEYLEKRVDQDNGSWWHFSINRDYNEYVDGKPRYEGVKSFLESRGIELPWGDPDDPPGKETICGLGNKKNRLFNERLEKYGVETYETAVEFVHLVKNHGLKVAVVSSSKNCRKVLMVAGLDGLFDARVDGVVSEQLDLKGKPQPDIFLEAARNLGVTPDRAIVMEDAVSGVRAGLRGGFGAVIGIDRIDHAEELRENGADIVIRTFSELSVEGERPVRENEIEKIPSALESMDDIRKKVSGKRPFIALDYDGTLTPIVERPEMAKLSDEMRDAVISLSKQCTVAVISGRDLEDVRQLVGIDNLYYAGSHGFDIAGPGDQKISSSRGSKFLPVLDRAEKAIHCLVDNIPGAQVERKKFSVAVHYRRVEEDRISDVEKAVDHVLSEHEGLRKGTGKKVFEMQPEIDWNKGKALCWLMEKLELDRLNVVPFYLGDDVTDEDAFAVIQEKGIGILVKDRESIESGRRSAAKYTLGNTSQVKEFLGELTGLFKGE